MNAVILWIFGQYGTDCGIIAGFICSITQQRVLLTYFYLSNFTNPLLHPSDRKARTERMADSNMVDANLGFLFKNKTKEPVGAIEMNPVAEGTGTDEI
jgi:hypothetical protein